MSRVVQVDLDVPDVATLEAIWAELHKRHRSRESDPRLHDLLMKRLETVELAIAEEIRAQLARVHPAAVLYAYLDVFIPRDMPALGAFLKGKNDQRSEW